MNENGKKKQIEELKRRVEKLEEQVLLVYRILELMTQNGDDIDYIQKIIQRTLNKE